MKKFLIGLVVFLVALGMISFRAVRSVNKAVEDDAIVAAAVESEVATLRTMLFQPASPKGRARDDYKFMLDERKYLEPLFEEIAGEVAPGATKRYRFRKPEFDPVRFRHDFVEALATRAQTDHHPELSAAIHRVALTFPSIDTSDWKPLEGSNPRPKR